MNSRVHQGEGDFKAISYKHVCVWGGVSIHIHFATGSWRLSMRSLMYVLMPCIYFPCGLMQVDSYPCVIAICSSLRSESVSVV